MNLPTYETDYFEIDDAEAIHREYPDSFWLPEKVKRESIETGDLVKLIFRMEETKGSDDVSVERMWVRVTEVSKQYYIGKLDNDPAGSDCVFAGHTFSFNACHIIDIYESDDK